MLPKGKSKRQKQKTTLTLYFEANNQQVYHEGVIYVHFNPFQKITHERKLND